MANATSKPEFAHVTNSTSGPVVTKVVVPTIARAMDCATIGNAFATSLGLAETAVTSNVQTIAMAKVGANKVVATAWKVGHPTIAL